MFFQINVNLPCFALFVIVFVLFWYLFSLVEKKKKDGKKSLSNHMKEPFAQHIKTLHFH